MSGIKLYRELPGACEREILGTITENQLDFLMENLDDEFDEDMEYFLDSYTVDYLKDQGADASLLVLMEKALHGHHNGVDIIYTVE